jgi:sulfhydrogenase subunit beta (sulfur reductase)
MDYFKILKKDWDKRLEELTLSHSVFASIQNEFGQDYEPVRPENIQSVIYNKPKPQTSLKTFFLPVKENVSSDELNSLPRIIIGIPNCDIEGLNLLDEIYIDSDFNDIFFRNRRNNTLLISADCFGIQEHCHCTSYGIKPYSTQIADLAAIQTDDSVFFRTLSGKGKEFLSSLAGSTPVSENSINIEIDKKHRETEALLDEANKKLPDFNNTGKLIGTSDKDIWQRYSSKCVSCGACTTICPTCSCFLLIDKPGFEKVKQMDACQYPGFEKVAGGEDPLHEIAIRFMNRYMCKYIWKSKKFKTIACTGCGRCIDACIGKINKNEIFMELAK